LRYASRRENALTMEHPPPNDADAARPERYRPTYHRASSQRSAALARDILTRLKSIEDPDLEATNEREPEPTTTAPFSKRACAKRLRSFATSRRLPTDDGAPPELLARMGFELITTDIVTILKCVECGAGAPPFASVDQAEAAHKKGCARRGCAVPSSVWDYSPACVREREQQLLETLDLFAVRDSESMKGAASLARRGWDAASSTEVECAFCARVVTVTADVEDVAHRCWCPRAKIRTHAEDVLPPAKRSRLAQ
jgi:hypothetical protein